MWDELHLGIVFIQEHWIPSVVHSVPFANKFSRRPHGRGWTVFWRYKTTSISASTAPSSTATPSEELDDSTISAGRSRGGVAIAIRTSLIRDGTVRLVGDAASVGPKDGRVISLNIDWAGHKLSMACLYLPNHAPERAQFLQDRLVPLAASAVAARRQLVWGGDFNFVHNPSLDRLTTVGGEAMVPTATTEATANVWAALPALATLVDVFRLQHPTSRHMTWLQPNGHCGSRLDRFYTSDTLSTQVVCPSNLLRSALRRCVNDSDHTVVVCHLAPLSLEHSSASSSRPTNAPPRLNISFMKDPCLSREFEEWLDLRLASLPTTDEAVKRWWLKFKSKTLKWKIRSLNRDFFFKNQHRASVEALRDTLATLTSQVNGNDTVSIRAALAEIPHVRAELGRLERELEAFYQTKTRKAWIHSKERPSIGLTKILGASRHVNIPALLDSSGTLQTSAARCANVVIDYWAGISAAPTTTAAAQTAVLAAVEAQGVPQLQPQTVQQLGSSDVTEAEILSTLRKCSPHTASGPDGIPMKLYKTFRRGFAPLFSRVFTSIGKSGSAPRSFLKSVITSIPKPANSLLIANTRPISLTGTDYRVLTRALGSRLGAVLPTIIDPVQTAFLRGRHIGDTAMLMQFLPAWLQQHHRSALMVFCDFRKAYDTLDRNFLSALALKMGLGEDFVSWMKLLLTDTRSAAIIDGYLSDYRLLLAGARQGCPLSPPLYLLVAQAALMWLREKGFGVEIDDETLTALQHADDTKVLLNGPEDIPAFLDAMTIFAQASGQHLQPAKTRLLFLGTPPEQPLPESIHGLPVVSSVTALGLTFSQFTGAISVDWVELLTRVHSKVDMIVKCKLSSFGRAFAINSYALSKILYFAQFTGLPEGRDLHYLERLLPAAVDRDICLRLPPWISTSSGPSQRRFSGISRALMPAHPRFGGLGLLPLPEHVNSRIAWWALRLITGSATTPWIRVARSVLSHLLSTVKSDPGQYGVAVPFPCPQLVLLTRPATSLAAHLGVAEVPVVLERLCSALRALPRPSIVAPVPAGPWCAALPLWSNPLLLDNGAVALEHSQRCPNLGTIACPAIITFGGLLRLRLDLETWAPGQYEQRRQFLKFPGWLEAAQGTPLQPITTVTPPVVLYDGSTVEMAGASTTAAAIAEASSTSAAAAEMLISCMGWRIGRRTINLASFQVKVGTILQLASRPAPQVAPMSSFSSRQCGLAIGPTRIHLYHQCAIVQPTWLAVQQQLCDDFSIPTPGLLQRRHIWMGIRPHPRLHQGIWDIVAIKLLAPCESGRKNWFDRVLKLQLQHVTVSAARRRGGGRGRARSSRTTGSIHRPMAPGPAMIASVSQVVLAEFWSGLTEIASLGVLPPAWLQVVPLNHPFLHPDSTRSHWVVSSSINQSINYSLSSDIVATEARIRVCLSAAETHLYNLTKNKAQKSNFAKTKKETK
ncbi:hypothetical protein KSW81_005182 [Nannochloris sp. 'desiccata']|nr:hypothetical protein KSW81_005182 [Chlorella desiccata (nom. nud.)]